MDRLLMRLVSLAMLHAHCRSRRSMSRILIATSPEKGHLNPMMGVAQWLRRLGHTVGWLCLPEPAPQLDRLGVEVLHLPQPEAPAPAPIETSGEALARLVRRRGGAGPVDPRPAARRGARADRARARRWSAASART